LIGYYVDAGMVQNLFSYPRRPVFGSIQFGGSASCGG
jgi:hypothetical protein